MLDFIRTCPDAPERMLIPAAARQAAAQGRRVLAEARRQASQIVAAANQEAEQIRNQALSEGYSQGVLQAAGEITQALLLKQGMAAHLQVEVAECVRALLREALASEDWLEALLQQWLREISISTPGSLQVVVPEGTRVGQLRQRLTAHWPGTLVLEHHEQARFLFRHGDQLLEFDIPGAVESMVPRLMQQMTGLRPALRTVEETSADYLRSWVDGVLGEARAWVGEQTEHAD